MRVQKMSFCYSILIAEAFLMIGVVSIIFYLRKPYTEEEAKLVAARCISYQVKYQVNPESLQRLDCACDKGEFIYRYRMNKSCFLDMSIGVDRVCDVNGVAPGCIK